MKFRVQGLGYILGLYGDNGKENGNYYNGVYMEYMGGCQNCGPFLDPYSNTAPNIWGTQKGTIILTTTHMDSGIWAHSSMLLSVLKYCFFAMLVILVPGGRGAGGHLVWTHLEEMHVWPWLAI